MDDPTGHRNVFSCNFVISSVRDFFSPEVAALLTLNVRHFIWGEGSIYFPRKTACLNSQKVSAYVSQKLLME